MTTERSLLSSILVAASRLDARLFRNNTGLGWVGQVQHLTRGTVLLQNARPLHAGLCTGSSDLIGWRTVTITPDMIGQRVAVFTAIEGKTGRARTSEEQETFIRVVTQAGGIAGVARSVEEAVRLIRNMPIRLTHTNPKTH